MDDGIITESAQMLFPVNKHGGENVLKNISSNSGITSTPFEQTVYHQLCDASHDGMFIWKVYESDEYNLAYANQAFYDQADLPVTNTCETYDTLFSNNEAFIARSQLNTCVKSGQPVICNNTYAGKTFCVSLYPSFENGHIAHVAGTSVDISKHVCKTHQLESTKNKLFNRDQGLKEQVQFEELLACVSRDFLDSGHSGFTMCIDQLTAGLGSLLKVDWACVWKSDGAIFCQCCEWHAIDAAKNILMFKAALNSGIGTWTNQCRSGKIIVISDLEADNPRLFSALNHPSQQESIRSILIVPILRGNDFWGIICVAQQDYKRAWNTLEISRLKTAAGTVMSAYLRMKMEKQLSESNKVLAEYDECLQDMLSVQESLANVSKQYTLADSQHFSSCTKDMLEVLVGLTEVDLACIHVFDNESFVFYEWCKKGLPCGKLQYNPVLPTLGFMDFLRDNEYFIIGNTAEEQGPIPSFLMDTMLSLGIKSFMIIPIRNGGTIWGVLVLCKVLGCDNWNNMHIHTAKQFAEVFYGAYLRMCRENELILANQNHRASVYEAAKHADILQSVAKSAHMFFDATVDNLSKVFSSVCEEIREMLQIQSVSLTRFNEDFTKTCIIFDWFPPCRSSKRSGNTMNFQDNTTLSIPVLYRESVWGCLRVNFASKKPSDAYLDTLGLMAQYYANAYMRIYSSRHNRFSHNTEKPCLKTLSFTTQPAAI